MENWSPPNSSTISPAQHFGRPSWNESKSNGSQVIWNSDNNSLFVVANIQQHQLEKYLETVDKPQPLIAVEAFLKPPKTPENKWVLIGQEQWMAVMD